MDLFDELCKVEKTARALYFASSAAPSHRQECHCGEFNGVPHPKFECESMKPPEAPMSAWDYRDLHGMARRGE